MRLGIFWILLLIQLIPISKSFDLIESAKNTLSAIKETGSHIISEGISKINEGISYFTPKKNEFQKTENEKEIKASKVSSDKEVSSITLHDSQKQQVGHKNSKLISQEQLSDLNKLAILSLPDMNSKSALNGALPNSNNQETSTQSEPKTFIGATLANYPKELQLFTVLAGLPMQLFSPIIRKIVSGISFKKLAEEIITSSTKKGSFITDALKSLQSKKLANPLGEIFSIKKPAFTVKAPPKASKMERRIKKSQEMDNIRKNSQFFKSKQSKARHFKHKRQRFKRRRI